MSRATHFLDNNSVSVCCQVHVGLIIWLLYVIVILLCFYVSITFFGKYFGSTLLVLNVLYTNTLACGLWLVLMCDTAFYVDHLYINPLSTVHYVQILYVCVFTSALLPVHYTPQRPAAVQPLQVGLASLSNWWGATKTKTKKRGVSIRSKIKGRHALSSWLMQLVIKESADAMLYNSYVSGFSIAFDTWKCRTAFSQMVIHLTRLR